MGVEGVRAVNRIPESHKRRPIIGRDIVNCKILKQQGWIRGDAAPDEHIRMRGFPRKLDKIDNAHEQKQDKRHEIQLQQGLLHRSLFYVKQCHAKVIANKTI